VRTLAIRDGNLQSGPPGATLPINLVVEAQDNGVGVNGVVINYSVIDGTDAGIACCVTTAGGGFAGAALTLRSSPGPVQVRAERSDDPSVFVVFTATALARGLVYISGDNQSAVAGAALQDLLVVQSQLGGAAEANITIDWSSTATSATLTPVDNPTDGNGNGTAQVTCGATGETFNIVAARFDDPSINVTFTATCTVTRTLVIHDGNNQVGAIDSTLPANLVVEARDNGVGVDGVVINFTVLPGGDATVGTCCGTTAGGGFAGTSLDLGSTPGPVQVRAERADDPSVFVVFDAVIAQPVLSIISGNNQQGNAGQLGDEPLVVELRDGTAANEPIANATIAWNVASGDATLNGTPSTTGLDGRTSVQFQYGAPGASDIVATHATGATATFTVTALEATLALTSGDGQSGLTGTKADLPLVVTLRDGFGQPMALVQITWTATGSGYLDPAVHAQTVNTLTDNSGQAQVPLYFDVPAGPITITATPEPMTGGGPAPVVFTATSINAVIGAASGNNQTGPVNTTLPLPIVVQVGEVMATTSKTGGVGAQALDGVPVTFTVTSGGGSVTNTVVLTDASGQASTPWTLGPIEGAQTVSASVPGGASVTFTATATISRTLTLVSGSGQAAAPGSPLPNPLVVHAQDNGMDAPGIAITWTLVSGSASITPSGATDTDGLANATVTLGAVPGSVSIRAERADDPTVFVVFTANQAKLQQIPGLSPDELELAIVIDQACATLAGQSSLTPPQQDFLDRCQELIDGSILDPGAVRDALDALLPGAYLAFSEAAFNAAQAQFQNLKARIAALRSGTQGNSFQGLALNGPGGTVSLGALGAALTQDGDEPATPSGEVGTDFQRWGFFASGTIGRGEAEAGSTRPAYDYDINGLTVGLDYRKSDTFIFGGALGYTRQDTELQGAPGQMDMSGWSVSGYATWYRDNSWYTDAVLTWGRNSFDLLRTITYTVPTPGGGSSSISQTARSQSDGDMLEGAFTFGRDFQAGGWSIGPYGRILYTKLDFERIVDEMDSGPGSGLGLEIDARTLTSLASEIGAKFTYAHSTDWGVVTPHIQLEWEHEFKDDPKALTARFLADPNGTPFSLSGEEIDTDYFRMSLGLSIIMQRGRSGFLIYERTVGREGFFQDNLGFGIRIEF
jgi:uncharacterized protein with beta-barrel porin domain